MGVNQSRQQKKEVQTDIVANLSSDPGLNILKIDKFGTCIPSQGKELKNICQNEVRPKMDEELQLFVEPVGRKLRSELKRGKSRTITRTQTDCASNKRKNEKKSHIAYALKVKKQDSSVYQWQHQTQSGNTKKLTCLRANIRNENNLQQQYKAPFLSLTKISPFATSQDCPKIYSQNDILRKIDKNHEKKKGRSRADRFHSIFVSKDTFSTSSSLTSSKAYKEALSVLTEGRLSVVKKNETNSPRNHVSDLNNLKAIKCFTPGAIRKSLIPPVPLIRVYPEHEIFICDIGLTRENCHDIIAVTEQCTNGSYSSYTLSKQAMECRKHNDLALVCEEPVMTACSTIRSYVDKVRKNAKNEKSMDATQSGHSEQEEKNDGGKTKEKELVLDNREPHIVKYDVATMERRNLPMHTDKSDWTFIIALSQGGGLDYSGGGTYFQCCNTTVHLQQGQAVIFPGRLSHRGEKINKGVRFLLVGFLLDKPVSSLDY